MLKTKCQQEIKGQRARGHHRHRDSNQKLKIFVKICFVGLPGAPPPLPVKPTWFRPPSRRQQLAAGFSYQSDEEISEFCSLMLIFGHVDCQSTLTFLARYLKSSLLVIRPALQSRFVYGFRQAMMWEEICKRSRSENSYQCAQKSEQKSTHFSADALSSESVCSRKTDYCTFVLN